MPETKTFNTFKCPECDSTVSMPEGTTPVRCPTCRTGTLRPEVGPMPDIITHTVEVKGIELPWQRVRRYEPNKGAVEAEGVVFIPMSTLYGLAEQDRWDGLFGSPFLLGFHEGLALSAAGLAEEETRGGYHRTAKLLEFLGLEESDV